MTDVKRDFEGRIDLKEIDDKFVLDEIYEIEELLDWLAALDEDVEHFQKLKEHRVKTISASIDAIEEKQQQIRGIIQRTMTALSSKKTLVFPGIAKTTRSKRADSVEWKDEGKVIEFFEGKGMKDEVTKLALKKKEAKKLVLDFHKKKEAVPGAPVKAGQESLTITFLDESDEQETPAPRLDSVPIDALDSLDDNV